MIAALHNPAAHRTGTCRRKRRYRTRWAAYMAAESASRRAGHRIEPYHCQHCRGWHIGRAARATV